MAGHVATDLPPRVALTRQSTFSSAYVHPLAADRLLEEKYGVEWLLWEPETLWTTITKDFALHAELSRTVRAGLQAVRTLHNTDQFFEEWQVTNWVTQALDGTLPDFDSLQDAEPGQLMHAVYCAKLSRGNMPYADEVQKWMACEFLDAGLLYAPPPLEFIQDEIAMMEAHCRKCGNVEWSEGLTECPNCGAGRDQLDILARHQWTMVKDMWSLIKNKVANSVSLAEDMMGVQMARLLAARDHLNDRVSLLNTQLKELDFGPVPTP
jgi:ribosomal protein L37E